jgi:hypothetical protein
MYKIVFLLVLLHVFSCSSVKENSGSVTLIKTESVKLPLDSGVVPQSKAIFYLENEPDKNLVGYLNLKTVSSNAVNEIVVFDLDNACIHKRIQLDREGEDGVGKVRGFWFHNRDSIFITSLGDKKVYLVNDAGKVMDKFPYHVTTDGMETGAPFYSRSHINTPLVIIDSKIYLTNYLIGNYFYYDVIEFENQRLCLEIDMKTKAVKFMPLTCPKGYWDETNHYEPTCARVFDGKRFIYLWRYFDKILVTTDHVKGQYVPIQSKYIGRFTERSAPTDLTQHQKRLLESGAFYNLAYDHFNEVYYVFVYPGIEVDTSMDLMKTWDNLPVFSILILDKDFNIMDEILMPEKFYYLDNFLSRKKGYTSLGITRTIRILMKIFYGLTYFN